MSRYMLGIALMAKSCSSFFFLVAWRFFKPPMVCKSLPHSTTLTSNLSLSTPDPAIQLQDTNRETPGEAPPNQQATADTPEGGSLKRSGQGSTNPGGGLQDGISLDVSKFCPSLHDPGVSSPDLVYENPGISQDNPANQVT